ncbi:MAG: tRNA pseudouridine(54/55) synthase Pus10 [Thaumarchaeota archaeon]|nr:MAG: tRNA pseudouridine(54/55) synthase Pus10 [Nitrososphaerota archaeon]
MELSFEKLVEVLEKAAKILEGYPLCDYCLGRQFSSLCYGAGNDEKGRAIKLGLIMNAIAAYRESGEIPEILRRIAETGFSPAVKTLQMLGEEAPKPKPCYICGGALSRSKFREMAEKIIEELKEYEFRNFVVGARIPAEIREREDELRASFQIDSGEDIKEDVTRGIGPIIQKRLNIPVEYQNPEIVVLVDVFSDAYEIQVNPLFIKGYYRKLQKNIPQTPWYCRYCWGRGCEKCGYTGREYPESISELIGEPAMRIFEAVSYKFHGAGREDVDATVTGTGRPFILELKHPRKRFIDLSLLEKEINENAKGKVEVSNLAYSSRRELRMLKNLSSIASKTYEAIVEFDGEVSEDALREVEERFRDIVIEQRTPRRVLRRRADKIRQKKLYYVKAEKLDDKTVRFVIKTQGGLYVKELIHGDEGRTKPNIAEFLGRTPIRIDLTVIEVEAPKVEAQEKTGDSVE